MSTECPGWDRARAVADAVLYEGYLLYPYRATSSKNRARWQFGVVGPPGAADSGVGEDDSMSAQFVVRGVTGLRLVVRFLQLQHRAAERAVNGGYQAVDELVTSSVSWITWDEAIEVELAFGPLDLDDPCQPWSLPITVAAGTDVEAVDGGRLRRERHEIAGVVQVSVDADGPVDRVTVTVRNSGAAATDGRDAITRSMIGTHVIAEALTGSGGFVSLLDPPEDAAAAARRCEQHRCFPVLAGPAGSQPGLSDLLLISPIILYDHPEVAEQSRGALYDSTEIDEILTLRVMTMTDEEKAQARATDPLAARIIDRCDSMSAEAMLELHGVLRDPHAGDPGLIPEIPEGVDWWDPLADTAVAPDIDAVMVNGVRVAHGSRVRLRPSRRADAQDMFVAGKTARVTSVHEDVDGQCHVAVVVDDDPAADLHELYGRYLYFSPDEIEPVSQAAPERREPWM
jgi:hypothetical protein